MATRTTTGPGTWIALLRGINVGGKNMVPMAELRELFTRLGHLDVATYIQSGNVIFRSPAAEPDIAAGCESALLKRFKKPLRVVLRSAADLQRTVKGNPYPDADPSRVMVVFCAARPAAAAVAALDPNRSPPDTYRCIGRDLYMHCPNGFGRTKFTLDYLERYLGTHASARNWRTVTTLADWPMPSSVRS